LVPTFRLLVFLLTRQAQPRNILLSPAAVLTRAAGELARTYAAVAPADCGARLGLDAGSAETLLRAHGWADRAGAPGLLAPPQVQVQQQLMQQRRAAAGPAMTVGQISAHAASLERQALM
jgi:hypothetical protein